MEELNKLKEEEKDLLVKLRENNFRQREIIISLYFEETGLKVGDKVSVGKKQGVIASFSVSRAGKLRPVVKIIEDGKLTDKLIKISNETINKLP